MKLDILDKEGLALAMIRDAVNLGEKLCKTKKDIARTFLKSIIKAKICHYDYRFVYVENVSPHPFHDKKIMLEVGEFA